MLFCSGENNHMAHQNLLHYKDDMESSGAGLTLGL